MVVPHVVRGPDIEQQNLRAIDTGEGQSIELRHISVPVAANAAQPHAAYATEPNYGTVPASSAPAAALQALNQIRSGTENMQQPPPVSASR